MHVRESSTLYVLEPDLNDLENAEDQVSPTDAHTMNPVNVLRLASRWEGR